MAVRKYLFWKSEDGIRTYKVTKGNTYELLHPLGRDIFPGKNLTDFFSWFHKSAAITEDEYIDFCFLSDEEIESPLLEYSLNHHGIKKKLVCFVKNISLRIHVK